ncbi:hypothetical protein ACHAXR_011520 [Thalassiosira sp. AJA248-18]
MSFLPSDHRFNANHEEHSKTSSLFPSTNEQQPATDPGAPAHLNFLNGITQPAPKNITLLEYDSNDAQSPQQSKWTKDDVILVIVLPIILTILFAFSLRHCFIANRRHAQFHERRQNIRAAERAHEREQRRLKEKRRKERLKEVEKALISKTASKCNCNMTSSTSMSDLTMHTNVTDDMSLSSSSHDIENPEVDNNSSSIANGDNAGETSFSQTCAICLEQYQGGKDKVSWSKFQTCCHAFHHKCIHGWLAETKNRDGSCPCCRGPYLKERPDDAKSDALSSQTPTDGREENEERTGDQAMENRNENVQTQDEESNVDEVISVHANVQTEEESNVDCEVATSMLEGNVSSIKAQTTLDTTKHHVKGSDGSDFVSFCIVHGLIRDKKKKRGTGGAFAVKPIDEPTGLENA